MNIGRAKFELYLEGSNLGVFEVLRQPVGELFGSMKGFKEALDVVEKKADMSGSTRDIQ